MIDEIPHLDRAPLELTELARLWELGLLEDLVVGEWNIHVDRSSALLGGVDPTHWPFLNVNLWVFGRGISNCRLAFTAEYFPEGMRPELGRLVRDWRDGTDRRHRLLKWTRWNIKHLDHRMGSVPTWYLMNHTGNLEWSKGSPPSSPYGLSAQ